jgi:hypothetical protein
MGFWNRDKAFKLVSMVLSKFAAEGVLGQGEIGLEAVMGLWDQRADI